MKNPNIRALAFILISCLFFWSVLFVSIVYTTNSYNEAGDAPHLCGTSYRDHISVDGKVDVAFCLEYSKPLEKVVLSYINGSGGRVNVTMYLIRRETDYDIRLNKTTYREWYEAKNLEPPITDAEIIVYYSGKTVVIPVSNLFPSTTITSTKITLSTPVKPPTSMFSISIPALIIVLIAVIATTIAIALILLTKNSTK